MTTTKNIMEFFGVSPTHLTAEQRNAEFIGDHLDSMVEKYKGEPFEESTFKNIVYELQNELREMNVPADTWTYEADANNSRIITLTANQELYYHLRYSFIDNMLDGTISYIGKSRK